MTERNPAADAIIGLYDRHAEAWDAARARSSFFERPLIDRFTDSLPPGASILDLGCGAGFPIAAHLLERGFAVTGVDAAPSLIARCRARYPAGEWIVADMRALDLGRRFDAIIAWHSFFHLAHADQAAMFPVFARHAAPGGRLLFTSGDSHGEAIGEFGGEPLYHASLDADAYRALLDEAGFVVEDQKMKDENCGGARWWLARRI